MGITQRCFDRMGTFRFYPRRADGERRTEDGRQRIVRHLHLREREVMTGTRRVVEFNEIDGVRALQETILIAGGFYYLLAAPTL
jgi:hypothetical protein